MEGVEEQPHHNREPATDQEADPHVAPAHFEGKEPQRPEERRGRKKRGRTADEVERHPDEPVRNDTPASNSSAHDRVQGVARRINRESAERAVEREAPTPELLSTEEYQEEKRDADGRRDRRVTRDRADHDARARGGVCHLPYPTAAMRSGF